MENLERIANDLKKIAEQIRKENQPEEGKYWRWDGHLNGKVVRIDNVSDNLATYTYLGGRSGDCGIGFLQKTATPLSDSEAQQALIEEAERRGYPAKEWKDPIEPHKVYCNPNQRNDLKYHSDDDALINWGGSVYEKGDWAEIIADEWEVRQIGGNAIVVNESCATSLTSARMIKDTTHGLTEEEAETIAKALNR